jgi:hypothetical protein
MSKNKTHTPQNKQGDVLREINQRKSKQIYILNNHKMDILQDLKDGQRKSFLGHVFTTTEEGKAELLNVIQYAILGIIPIVVLNKLVQRFVPDADTEKSSLEILAEIIIQLIVMFCGIIIIHRVITYFPTYSGFKYENLVLTNVILAFLIILLSIQTKMGIKVNILVDRFYDLWNGTNYTSSASGQNENVPSNVRISRPISQHVPSQADHLDNSHMQQDLFPPAPVATSKQSHAPPQTVDYGNMYQGPMAANSVLGGSFGSFF